MVTVLNVPISLLNFLTKMLYANLRISPMKDTVHVRQTIFGDLDR